MQTSHVYKNIDNLKDSLQQIQFSQTPNSKTAADTIKYALSLGQVIFSPRGPINEEEIKLQQEIKAKTDALAELTKANRYACQLLKLINSIPSEGEIDKELLRNTLNEGEEKSPQEMISTLRNCLTQLNNPQILNSLQERDKDCFVHLQFLIGQLHQLLPTTPPPPPVDEPSTIEKAILKKIADIAAQEEFWKNQVTFGFFCPRSPKGVAAINALDTLSSENLGGIIKERQDRYSGCFAWFKPATQESTEQFMGIVDNFTTSNTNTALQKTLIDLNNFTREYVL